MELAKSTLLHSGTTHVWDEFSRDNGGLPHKQETPKHTGDKESLRDLLLCFHKAVFLLSAIGPNFTISSGPTRSDKIKIARPLWHKFLDELSWLGDYELGGKSVTSIGVEDGDVGVRYWVAANGRVREKTFSHIKWVLQRLQTVEGLTKCELKNLAQEIFVRSIGLSRKKIANYTRRLNNYIRHAVSIGLQHRSKLGKFSLSIDYTT
jgi:hypothetical protein